MVKEFAIEGVETPDEKEIIHFAFICGVEDYYAKNVETLILDIIKIFTYVNKPVFVRQAKVDEKGKEQVISEILKKYKIYEADYLPIIKEYQSKVEQASADLREWLGLTYAQVSDIGTKLEVECAYKLINLMKK